MKYKFIVSFLSLTFTGAFFSGCKSSTSSGGDGTTASFKVQLESTDALFTQALIKPFAVAVSLTAKLGGVDLLASCTGGNPPGTCLDDGLAPDPDIWINEGCDDDIAQCTTSNTEYFELISPTAANTELNSQGRSIDVGTFTHVRVYFLNNDAGDAVECDGNEVPNVRPGVPFQIELPEELTVTAGESVIVTLSYDPSTVDCSDDDSISAVFSGLTATATKE